MATISENLQIIADSTAAIKQAIIDKGGEISGDITTWADAINGISGGGSSSEEEYTFTGTSNQDMMNIINTGILSPFPDLLSGRTFLYAFMRNSSGQTLTNCVSLFGYMPDDTITLTINYNEPINGNEIPAFFILNYTNYSAWEIKPVKFIEL